MDSRPSVAAMSMRPFQPFQPTTGPRTFDPPFAPSSPPLFASQGAPFSSIPPGPSPGSFERLHDPFGGSFSEVPYSSQFGPSYSRDARPAWPDRGSYLGSADSLIPEVGIPRMTDCSYSFDSGMHFPSSAPLSSMSSSSSLGRHSKDDRPHLHHSQQHHQHQHQGHQQYQSTHQQQQSRRRRRRRTPKRSDGDGNKAQSLKRLQELFGTSELTTVLPSFHHFQVLHFERIAGAPFESEESILRQFVSVNTRILALKFLRDPRSNACLNCGYIVFNSHTEAVRALQSLAIFKIVDNTYTAKVFRPLRSRPGQAVNIHFECCDVSTDSQDYFSRFGNVVRLSLVPHRTGVGFVVFDKHSSAAEFVSRAPFDPPSGDRRYTVVANWAPKQLKGTVSVEVMRREFLAKLATDFLILHHLSEPQYHHTHENPRDQLTESELAHLLSELRAYLADLSNLTETHRRISAFLVLVADRYKPITLLVHEQFATILLAIYNAIGFDASEIIESGLSQQLYEILSSPMLLHLLKFLPPGQGPTGADPPRFKPEDLQLPTEIH